MIASGCLVSLALTLLSADAPPRWPGFLGARATPLKSEALPLTWSPDKNIAWSTPLPGHGQSSPVVWGDTVVTTSVEGENKETLHVVALDLAKGGVLWTHKLTSSDPVQNTLYVSRAAPTPVVDGRAVFAYFESGDVVALSLAGKELWTRSLSKDYGKFKNKFGLAASPLDLGDAIVILVDDEGASYLVALAKADGQTIWKTDRTSRVSWTSPALVPTADGQQIVISSAGSVDGYDPQSGKQLWSFAEVGGNTAATPLPFAPGKFLVAASAGRGEAARAEDAKKSNLAMAIEMVEGKPVPKVLWRNQQATPSFGSPVVHRDCAYWVNSQGVVFCLDARTGTPHYTQRAKQSIWATPLGVDDRVYLFGKDGLTTVLAAGPEFKVLSENQLWDPAKVMPDPAAAAPGQSEEQQRGAASFAGVTQYGVAAVSGSLLIRTGNRLYCLRQSPTME